MRLQRRRYFFSNEIIIERKHDIPINEACEEVVISRESNPEVLDALIEMGLSHYDDYLTKNEVEQIHRLSAFHYDEIPYRDELFERNSFKGVIHFEEFQFFTGIESIDDCLFRGCSKLERIILPKTITKIPLCMFEGCSSLTSVYIPDSVQSIEQSAFSNCSSLKGINIPNSVVEIGGLAFSGCGALSSLKLPNRLQTIAFQLFKGCNQLRDVTAPYGLKSIESRAFQGCHHLESFYIPQTVELIAGDCFIDCDNHINVCIDSGNDYYEITDGIIFNKDRTSLIRFLNNNTPSYIIPNSVKVISSGSFSCCSNLVSITIPSSVNTIESCAFLNCEHLVSVFFQPRSLNNTETFTLEGSAFEGCINCKHSVNPVLAV